MPAWAGRYNGSAMLVSIEWLKEFISIRQSPEEVADLLTMAGLEVDSSEEVNGDTVLEIDLTPNRGDCLSVIGIAREISAVTGRKIRMPRFRLPSEDKRSWMKVSIDNRDLCPRYAGRIIKGVKIGESPDWMKRRLEASGIRPINNIVDVTNYVMLEYGQPLHAFDLDRLKAGHIRVATPSRTIRFKTLDGAERKITKDMLLIWDGDRPVAVAGVMGGLDSEVSDGTTSIFLESACFNPSSVRRTSSALGLRTESSFRFERGIDILGVDRALDRASFLISELAGGLLCKKVDVFPRKYRPRRIKVHVDRVNALLGTNLSRTRIQDLIARTGAFVEDFDEYLHVEVPSYRNDLEAEVDLIEEVARLYGYHRIAPAAPEVKVEAARPGRMRKTTVSARHLLCSRGYTEVINYSFMNPEALDLLEIPEKDYRRRAIPIMNPLRQEESLVRTTLIPSLIENFVYNFNRGMRSIKLFETARVFIDKGVKNGRLPQENNRISGLYFDDSSHLLWDTGLDPYFHVKGDADALIQDMAVRDGVWERSSEPFLHPGRSADFRIGDEKAGVVGVLSPEVVRRLDLKTGDTPIVVFDFDLDMLMQHSSAAKIYEKFSRFPSVQRDISILVDAEKTAQDLLDTMREFRSDLISDIKVFDYYRGGNIPGGKASLAFNITYRSFERTLSEEEVDSVHKDFVDFLLEKTGAVLRS